jgi:hypothetical protein
MLTGDKSKTAIVQQPQEPTQLGFGGFGSNQPSQGGFGGFGTSQQVQSGFGSFGASAPQQPHDQVIDKMAGTINILAKKLVAQGEQLAAQEKRLTDLEAHAAQGAQGKYGNGNTVSDEFRKFHEIFHGALGNLEKKLLQGQGNGRYQVFQDEDNNEEYRFDSVVRQTGYRGRNFDPNYHRQRGQAPRQQQKGHE